MAGILFMLLSSLFFTASDVLGKYLTQHYPNSQITWLRSIIGLFFIAVYAFSTGQARYLHSNQPGWHFFRSVITLILLIAIFYSLKNIPLPEFIAIIFSSPFFIALLSPWLLHEKVSKRSWIAIVIGFTGILIVTRPTPDHFHIAHLTALFCALCTATLTVTARRLATTESSIALNFYMYPFSIVAILYWTVSDWVKPTAIDWLYFIGLGFAATAALWCVVNAMKNARPAVVYPIDYVRVVWSITVAYFFWDEIPDKLTWLGIIVIMISGLYIVTHGRSAGAGSSGK